MIFKNRARLVPPSSIAGAPVEDAPVEAETGRDPLTGNRDLRLDQQLGIVGRLIGGGPEKPGNIATVIAILGIGFLFFGYSSFVHAKDHESRIAIGGLLSGVLSLVSAATGFVFGRRDKGD